MRFSQFCVLENAGKIDQIILILINFNLKKGCEILFFKIPFIKMGWISSIVPWLTSFITGGIIFISLSHHKTR